ncbi:hypothetical protein SUGI_0560680 [Cryptomeria japonica]|nr:hypothetical protein SUGI_0560680 [Cryptomeria japonica]
MTDKVKHNIYVQVFSMGVGERGNKERFSYVCRSWVCTCRLAYMTVLKTMHLPDLQLPSSKAPSFEWDLNL